MAEEEQLSLFPTDQELIDVVMAWGGEPKQSVCNWDCPTNSGGYCLDCHATAYNARELLRKRGYE